MRFLGGEVEKSARLVYFLCGRLLIRKSVYLNSHLLTAKVQLNSLLTIIHSILKFNSIFYKLSFLPSLRHCFSL